MGFLEQIAVIVLTPTAVVAVLAFLMRSLFNRVLDHDLERYKSELERQNQLFETRFPFFHEKRAEIISEFYSLMVRAVGQLKSLTATLRMNREKTLQEQKEETLQHLKEMSNFFQEHRLYFEEGTADKIESLIQILRESFVEFDVAQPGDEISHGAEADPEMWISAHEKLSKKAPPIKEELESNFRKIIHATR